SVNPINACVRFSLPLKCVSLKLGGPSLRFLQGWGFFSAFDRSLKKKNHHYVVGGNSSISINSRRNPSNCSSLSGVAGISDFFQTNTSPFPRFSRTPKFPSTKYEAGASTFNPPFGTGASTTAHSPLRIHSALSYGGIAIGRNPAATNRSSVLICRGDKIGRAHV